MNDLNNDVFHAYLVESADYEGYYEIPKVVTSTLIPERVVPFF